MLLVAFVQVKLLLLLVYSFLINKLVVVRCDNAEDGSFIHSRESYVQTELHVDRNPIPRTISSTVGPTDWNEALDIISFGSPEQVSLYLLFFFSLIQCL